jgi:hypothetical protein
MGHIRQDDENVAMVNECQVFSRGQSGAGVSASVRWSDRCAVDEHDCPVHCIAGETIPENIAHDG